MTKQTKTTKKPTTRDERIAEKIAASAALDLAALAKVRDYIGALEAAAKTGTADDLARVRALRVEMLGRASSGLLDVARGLEKQYAALRRALGGAVDAVAREDTEREAARHAEETARREAEERARAEAAEAERIRRLLATHPQE